MGCQLPTDVEVVLIFLVELPIHTTIGSAVAGGLLVGRVLVVIVVDDGSIFRKDKRPVSFHLFIPINCFVNAVDFHT